MVDPTMPERPGEAGGLDRERGETTRGLRLLVLPGVFRPRSDTWLLARAACREPVRAGARVLELCAGPGLAGIAAAKRHAGTLTTVDISLRAVWNARLNGRLNGIAVRALRGDLLAPVAGERFDLVVANPPYLPGPAPPHRGAARAWDAGADGRALLARICAQAPAHLAPGGVLLVVHSEVCDAGATLAAFAASGLEADVSSRRRGPLGPLLRARRDALESRGLLASGQRAEEVAVLRGRRRLAQHRV
jgi:release factor glutamine methyltransferase